MLYTFFALTGAIFILVGMMPELIRIARKKYGDTGPNVTSWFLWSCLSVSTLLNYLASGASPTGNSIPTYASCINPILIFTFTIVFYGNKIQKPNTREIICFCLVSLCLFLFYCFKDSRYYSQYVVYLGLFADLIAAWPLIQDVKKDPQKYRPFFWIMYSFGYALAIPSVNEPTFVNYSVPVYMSGLGILVGIPSIRYRILKRIPVKNWI